ncbi:YqiA/YcfP family alpha/beta fold hydrolase [Piscinibacter koreensis]|uniref:Esterase n=1 Tax=Piscinibacter koreensis TaxID=2742824 RepID=A0A7Y6NPQ4_9BURK|nr:YqiA/YcfP family alpha/beta fold hydrolase [Schlegelella koreensis]NUZ07066.1 esterase [Schlegelella koreensis]
MQPPVSHVLYLHGFKSSPQSTKARRMAAWFAENRPDVVWWCPQLPASPADAMALIVDGTGDWPAERSAVIGSSLGGFYATAYAERTGCRAVLLNPAIEPARDLEAHVGVTEAWHSEQPFEFRPEYVDELRTIHPRALTRLERYLAIIAKGDEVLSWEEMAARYAGCQVKLLEGSDHAISEFEEHLPEVIGFLGLEVPRG